MYIFIHLIASYIFISINSNTNANLPVGSSLFKTTRIVIILKVLILSNPPFWVRISAQKESLEISSLFREALLRWRTAPIKTIAQV